MTAELARAGGPLGAAGLALLLVATRRELRIAGLVAWAAGAALLLAYLAPSGHHRALAAVAAVGAVLAVALAALFLRRPWLLAAGTLACAPARIPVHVGSTQANLLVPLYGLIAAAALVLAFELLRGDGRSRELGPLAWPLAAFTAWTGLSLAWTGDLRQGSVQLLFFYLPFGLLAVAFARLPWSRRWLSLLGGQLALMAVAFALVGIVQWATRDVFWNRKVIVGNAYANFFRVNSVFFDPSIYGRFLALAIVIGLAVVLQAPKRRLAYAIVAGIAVAWVGLFFSFSQSSFVALFAGTLAAAAFTWRSRVAVVAGLVAVVLLAAGFSTRAGSGLDNASSGRFKLVVNGVRIAADHPLAGVGVGDFQRAYGKRLHLPGPNPKSAASHDTPVTVAAELGVPGLGLFAWLLAATLLVPLRRFAPDFRGRAFLALGLGLGVIAVHSLFYNALFEDPLFWGLLGLAALVVVSAKEVPE